MNVPTRIRPTVQDLRDLGVPGFWLAHSRPSVFCRYIQWRTDILQKQSRLGGFGFLTRGIRPKQGGHTCQSL